MAGEISPLLKDLAIILATAGLATIIFKQLKQPVILGYLLAGFIVGPYTFAGSLVSDPETVRTLGDIGVIFLLFALGLEFNFRKLRKVGATALVSGTLQVLVMIWIGYMVGLAFGLTTLGAIFLGAIISMSSTVIIVKVVSEYKQQDTQWAQIVFGILIVEDILAVLLITLLSATGGADALTPASVGSLLGMFALFIIGALVLGLLLVPRLVAFVAKMELDDVLVTVAVALGFGLAVLGGILGFSPALGAFLMGALIAESSAHKVVEEKILPIRDLFTSVFFVTVGMLVDPAALVEHWPLILAVTLAVIFGKLLAGSVATFLGGRDVPTSLRVGFGLAQVGEFSFILAALAASTGATDAPLYVVAVSAACVTAFTTPYLIRSAPRAVRVFERRAPRALLTYANLYAAWTGRLRDGRGTDSARRAAFRAAVPATIYGAVTIAIIVFGGLSVTTVGNSLASRAGREDAALVFGWLAVGIVALPFGFLYVRSQHAFARQLAKAAVPERLKVDGNVAPIQTVLERTFLFGGLLTASIALLLFASPFIPTAPLLAVVVVTLALTGGLLYKALTRVQSRVETTIKSVLSPSASETERAQLVELVREKYPWAASTKELTLPTAFPAPTSLRRLHLRNRTGASVVTIHRGDRAIHAPTPDTQLLPGDRLVLIGEDHQLEEAERLFLALESTTTSSGAPATPVLSEVDVPPGSPVAGRSLLEIRLPDRAGATVIGIERAGNAIPNPSPTEVLREGDRLVVLATPDQLSRVRMILAGGATHLR